MPRTQLPTWHMVEYAGVTVWTNPAHHGWKIRLRTDVHPSYARYTVWLDNRPLGAYEFISTAIDAITECERIYGS